jgi:DNA-binding transcriptional ArsR family regulator
VTTEDRVLTAMSHPLRRRLLDILKVYGPATASALAERSGQGVGNISHHIRILAEAGLVEEAPELARDRRERWWRRAVQTITWHSGDASLDPAAEAIELAAVSANLERQVQLVRDWLGASDDERAAWPEGPFSIDAWLRVTPAELTAFGAELMAVVHRWSEREIADDGQHRDTVFTFARAAPGRP